MDYQDAPSKIDLSSCPTPNAGIFVCDKTIYSIAQTSENTFSVKDIGQSSLTESSNTNSSTNDQQNTTIVEKGSTKSIDDTSNVVDTSDSPIDKENEQNLSTEKSKESQEETQSSSSSVQVS